MGNVGYEYLFISVVNDMNTAHIVFLFSSQPVAVLLCTFPNLILTIQAAPAYAHCYLATRAGELE